MFNYNRRNVNNLKIVPFVNVKMEKLFFRD